MVILGAFTLSFNWNYWITEVLGMSVYLLYWFVFHSTAPLTDHLSYSISNKNTFEIHMVFRTLFKIIRPDIGQKVDLIGTFSLEFLEAIKIMDETNPNKRFMTRTWLVHKKGREYLENSGFKVDKYRRSPNGFITELYMLRLGNESIINSIKSLIKHKNYKYEWSKEEGERLLSDLQNPETRRKLRIPANL